MKLAALRILRIVGWFFGLCAVAGIAAMSPITVALSVTGWFLTRSSIEYISEQPDRVEATPHIQYWARSLLLRTFGLMALGAVIAGAIIATGFDFKLEWHEQAMLTSLLIAVMVVMTKLTLPGIFVASWEIHGAPERRRRVRKSMRVSRFVLRAVASLLVVVSLAASLALMRSVQEGPRYDQVASLAENVRHEAPTALSEISGIFSPTESSAR